MIKIPVNIISGFLGSGKTTAIIQLLGKKSNNEQWAVIINEFGKVSIDGQTLKSGSKKGTVYEISGGCICCSAKGYFRENLDQIIQSGNYSRIIIEPSGLGGIDMVSEIVGANHAMQLMPVICLVDILGIENPRLQLNPIYRMQIAKASIIAFSKCDLTADSALQDRLIALFTSAFPEKQNCLIQSSNLFLKLRNIDSRINMEENKYRMLFGANQDMTDSNYQETHYQFGVEKIFDAEKLTQFFTIHPSIIRAKGFIHSKAGWNLFNFTLSGITFEPCLPRSQNELVIIAEKLELNLIHSSELETNCILN
jgi:G3E family GTPase